MRFPSRFASLLLIYLLALSSSPAHAADQWVDCTPVEVATYLNRVHVRCSTGLNGIIFFAIATNRSADETAFATRAVAIANTALVAGRPLKILYDFNDNTAAAFGCLLADCRALHSVAMW